MTMPIRNVEPGLLHLDYRRAQPQPARVAQQPQHRHDNEPAEAEDRIAAPRDPDRDLAETREKAGEGVMRRERMRRRRRHVAIAQLLEQRQEARAQIGQRDGVPARVERALGAQQQPGAGGVEPFDPGRVDNDGTAGRHLQRAQPPVESRGFGHEPIARGS
jgi:hypothetical protein